MIVRLKTATGSVFALTCQHVILHDEKGKDSWLEILGMHKTGVAGTLDNCYLLKGLCFWALWDHGQCISSNIVPLSVRLGRNK